LRGSRSRYINLCIYGYSLSKLKRKTKHE
jgi:hypothetical protein